MPIMFGAHNFYDINSGPILALSHNSIFNANYRHELPNSKFNICILT